MLLIPTPGTLMVIMFLAITSSVMIFSLLHLMGVAYRWCHEPKKRSCH
ncbi:MAG TPA: hypothetical protein VJ974_08805 [Geopsychrobacteraceae bacterium]|nr:hypothetical protein [Geopsychrobacteraceae bacterium]